MRIGIYARILVQPTKCANITEKMHSERRNCFSVHTYLILRSKITKPPRKVRDPKIISADTSIFWDDIFHFSSRDHNYYVIFVTSRTRHVFGVFNAIDWPIKTSYFRYNFRRNGPISKMVAPIR